MVIKQNVLVYYSIYILYTEKERLSQAVCQIKSSSDVITCVCLCSLNQHECLIFIFLAFL